MNDFIQMKTAVGEPIHIEQTMIIPETKVVELKFPFGGFVWNRPTAVTVAQHGRTETIPIQDVTRLALLTAVGLAVFSNLLILLVLFGKRRSHFVTKI